MAENEPLREPSEPAGDGTSNASGTGDLMLSKTLLKSLIDDDVYEILQRHFLMTGKGRRPNLPPVFTLTNWLLVQLFFLKEEANTTFAQMKLWLQKLIPKTATVSESRIYHRVNFLLDSCGKLRQDEALSFLQEEHDFQALSPPLAELNLNRLHLIHKEVYTQLPSEDVTNSVVVALEHLRVQERESPIFVRKWLRKLSMAAHNCSESHLKTKIKNTLNKYRQFPRYKKSELNDFLNEFFIGKMQPVDQGCQAITCQDCIKKDEIISHKENVIKELRQTNNKLFSSNKELNEKIVIQNKMISGCKTTEKDLEISLNDLKCLRTQLKQEIAQKIVYKEELDSLKSTTLYKQNYGYKRKLKEMEEGQTEVKNECKTLEKKVNHLKKKLKTEQTLKSNYKNNYNEQKEVSSQLSEMLMIDAEANQVKIKEEGSSHRFSNDIRKTYYALQGEGNVAASNCSNVIATVAKNLFGKELSDLPSNSSALNFSNEAHIIAKQQVIDEIKQADFFTYAHDGTSRDKSHYLEQHLQLSNGQILSLGFSEIASDDSETLLEKCIGVFKDMFDIYSLDQENCDENSFLKEIIKKMKCLLSDRAAVCKAFDAKMASFKENLLGGEDSSTHFIYCNAHFLLALSAAVEESILHVEEELIKETGEKLGRDVDSAFVNWDTKGESAAVRLIRLAADVLGPRGDEKSGCRQEWLAYMSAKGTKSTFCSFRNNRFNNLFQNASAVLKHKDDINIFLSEFVSHSNRKLQSVLADLKDERIISSIAVISFMHNFCTEPYWLLMNSNKNYSDFSKYVKEMKAVLGIWGSCDFEPSQATSIFEDFKATEDNTAVLYNYFNSERYDKSSFKNCLNIIIEKCVNAMNRQLSDFLDGGVFDEEFLEDSVKTILSKCPLTNLVGERLFGDLDYCMKKRRNASLHIRTTSNMWKHNKTARWLGKQSPSMSQKLIKKAVKFGPEWRQRHRDDKRSVMDQIKARIAENKNKKDEKDVKMKERKLAAIEAVLKHGSLVQNKVELDTLYSGPKALEKLKDQIRFRNLVQGEKISLTGTKKTLYDRLLSHISDADSFDSTNNSTSSD